MSPNGGKPTFGDSGSTSSRTTDPLNNQNNENPSKRGAPQLGGDFAETSTDNKGGKWALQRVHHLGDEEMYELAAHNVMGRNKMADIVLRSMYCCKKHCTIRVNGESVLLEDEKVIFI